MSFLPNGHSSGHSVLYHLLSNWLFWNFRKAFILVADIIVVIYHTIGYQDVSCLLVEKCFPKKKSNFCDFSKVIDFVIHLFRRQTNETKYFFLPIDSLWSFKISEVDRHQYDHFFRNSETWSQLFNCFRRSECEVTPILLSSSLLIEERKKKLTEQLLFTHILINNSRKKA